MNRILCIALFGIIAVAFMTVPSEGYVLDQFQGVGQEGWPVEEPSKLDDIETNEIPVSNEDDESLSPQILAEMDQAAARLRRMYPDTSDVEAELFREKRSDK